MTDKYYAKAEQEMMKKERPKNAIEAEYYFWLGYKAGKDRPEQEAK